MIEVNMGLKGTFEFILNEGTDREKKVKQDNAILNHFLTGLQIWTYAWDNYLTSPKTIMVGLNSTPVSLDQVELFNKVAAANAVNDPSLIPLTTDGTTWSHSILYTAVFGTGQVNATINEVGMNFFDSFTADTATVHSRAVLNSPLEVGPDDQLTVKYTLTMTGSDLDTIQNIVLNGTTHTVTMRRGSTQWLIRPLEQRKSVSFRTGVDASLGVAGGEPFGGVPFDMGSSTVGLNSTVAGQRVVRVSAATTQANGAGGIKIMYWGNLYQFRFDPPIPKDANSTLSLDLAYTIGRV